MVEQSSEPQMAEQPGFHKQVDFRILFMTFHLQMQIQERLLVFDGKILRTTNGGINWTSQSSGTTNWLWSVSFTDANTGTAVGEVGTILRTTNGGVNWISQTSGTSSALKGVSFTDINNGTSVSLTGMILRTTNGGTNWFSQTSGASGPLYSVSFTDVNTGTAVGYNGTIIRTTNGGTNWTSQSSGTTLRLHCVSFIDSINGTAVGDGGLILRTTTGGTSVNQINNKIPERFSLYQNYPNPFNPTTIIRFAIYKSAFTVLKVYDALGKEVATLVNEKLSTGSYEVDFNGTESHNLSSGVYFYHLEAGDFAETRKMVLVK